MTDKCQHGFSRGVGCEYCGAIARAVQTFTEQQTRQLNSASDRIAKLEADLLECREYLEGQMDVVDGDYGEPAPNKAMRLVNMIDERIHGRPY